MQTKQIQIYKFDELPKEAKQKAIDEHREINVDHEWWNYLIEDLCTEIKKTTNIRIDPKDVRFEIFSRSNCIYVDRGVIGDSLSTKYPKLINVDIPEKFGLFCNYLGGGMCSALNRSDFDEDHIDIEEGQEDSLENDIEKAVNEKIKEDIVEDLNKVENLFEEYYNKLYKDYNELITDDCVAETIRINEYTFLEDGGFY